MAAIISAVGTGFGGSSSGSTSGGWPTVYADNPPAGLTAVAFNNTTNDAPALQAQLDYVKNTYGGGRVVLSKPSGAGVKWNTGITIPAKVQLWSDQVTLINATAITSGAAITVIDNDFTPLVGIRMDGGMFSPTAADLTSSYTGISVTGHGLEFEDCMLQYFGRGYDLAKNGTYIVTIRGGSTTRCATCVYLDIEAVGSIVAGERVTIKDHTIANAVRGFNASAGGCHLRLENVSTDFVDEVGRINNARVFYSGHIETNDPYLFDMTGNAMLFMTDTELVLGQAIMVKAGQGPANLGFGGVRVQNSNAFFTNNIGVSGNVRSEHTFLWPANTTTQTVYVPWALKWCPVSVSFVWLDGNIPPNNDQITITGSTSAAGQINLSAPTNASARWAIIRFS